jgi:hypothetical protein
MTTSKNRSNISNKNNSDKLEQNDSEKSLCKCNESNGKSSFNWLTFWAFAIPAYTYFIGYNAKVYFLSGVGFDVAEISPDPGDVYHFAFESLLLITFMSVENALAIFKAAFISNWHFILPMTILVVIGSYFAFVYANKKYGEEPVSKVESSAKSKKARNQLKPIRASLFSGVAYVLINALAAPIIILLLIFLTIVFSPAPIIGKAMASYQKENFKCIYEPKRPTDIPSCSSIELKQGEPIIGAIFHRDSQYLHIYTSRGPLSLPIEEVKNVQRFRPASEKK